MLNRSVDMEKVLSVAYGVELASPSRPFPCPFPDHGSDDVHPSAQLHLDSNSVYCYAEQRSYTVYDALSAAGKTDRELEAFVVNSLGDAADMLLEPDKKLMEDFEALVSVSVEAALAKYRRGGASLEELSSAVSDYLDAVSAASAKGDERRA